MESSIIQHLIDLYTLHFNNTTSWLHQTSKYGNKIQKYAPETSVSSSLPESKQRTEYEVQTRCKYSANEVQPIKLQYGEVQLKVVPLVATSHTSTITIIITI